MNIASEPTSGSIGPVARDGQGGYPVRRLFMAIFLFAMFWLAFWAVLFVSVAQFVLRIFDTEASADLARFGGRLGAYVGEVVGYLAFARDQAPFPFSAFPKAAE